MSPFTTSAVIPPPPPPPVHASIKTKVRPTFDLNSLHLTYRILLLKDGHSKSYKTAIIYLCV